MPPKRPIRPSGGLDPFVLGIDIVRERVAEPDAYPFTIPAIRDLTRLPLHPRVTYLVGENGAGKSTLIEAVAVAAGFNAEGGSSNFQFSTRRSESSLCAAIRLVRGSRRPRTGFFLRAESFFNLAANVDELGVGDSYGGKSLHEQSHGESFLALLMNRFGRDGLYVLDEPEAALSPMRQMSALARIHQLVLEGSQFVIATHAPILLAYPGALIYELSDAGIREVPYEETATFAVTRDFILHRETMVRELLAEDERDA